MSGPIPIEFTSDGIRLKGFRLSPPDDSPARRTLVVLCHGLPSGRPVEPGDGGYGALAAELAPGGYPVVFFNFRGAGESGGDFSICGWERDLSALLDEWESGSLSGIADRVAVVASSAGALVAIRVAAADERIAGVCTWAAPADFGFVDSADASTWIAHFRSIGMIRDAAFPANPDAWYGEFAAARADAVVGAIAPRPLLLIHGDADDTMPIGHLDRLETAAGSGAEARVLVGGGHRLRLDGRAVAEAKRWLAECFAG